MSPSSPALRLPLLPVKAARTAAMSSARIVVEGEEGNEAATCGRFPCAAGAAADDECACDDEIASDPATAGSWCSANATVRSTAPAGGRASGRLEKFFGKAGKEGASTSEKDDQA